MIMTREKYERGVKIPLPNQRFQVVVIGHVVFFVKVPTLETIHYEFSTWTRAQGPSDSMCKAVDFVEAGSRVLETLPDNPDSEILRAKLVRCIEHLRS